MHSRLAIRTTLDKIGTEPLPHAGIYLLAYMGRVVYVGISAVSVEQRLLTHMHKALDEPLGQWLTLNADHANIRLDVLVPPTDAEPHYWLRQHEALLIQHFHPLLNTLLNH